MEKSKLAKMKFTLEDINEVNPVRKLIITISILSLLTTDSGKENKEIIATGWTCSFDEMTATLPAAWGRVLPEKLDGAVRLASQNPSPVYDQICDIPPYPIHYLTKYSKLYFWPDP